MFLENLTFLFPRMAKFGLIFFGLATLASLQFDEVSFCDLTTLKKEKKFLFDTERVKSRVITLTDGFLVID
jgi:hypothetical protein